jgi:hypothetical protein
MNRPFQTRLLPITSLSSNCGESLLRSRTYKGMSSFPYIYFQVGFETMIEEHVSHGGHIHLLLCLKLSLSQQFLFRGQGCMGELNPLF